MLSNCKILLHFQVRGGSCQVSQVYWGRQTIGPGLVKIQGQILSTSFGWCLCDLFVSPDFCHPRLNFPLYCLRIPFPIYGSLAPHLLLFGYRSFILLFAKLLGRQKTSQDVSARTIRSLGQQGGETERQHLGLYHLFTHHPLPAQLVYQHCFTRFGHSLETLLDRYIHWCCTTLIHCHSSRHNSTTVDFNHRCSLLPVCGNLGHLCLFKHFTRTIEK